MYLLLGGLALLGLNLYISVLAYSLRSYSRARLGELLKNESARGWVDWLDAHEGQLQVTTSFARLTINVAVLVYALGWYLLADGTAAATGLTWPDLIVPALATLLILMVVNIGIAHATAVNAGEYVLARSCYVLALLRIGLWPIVQTLRGIEFVVKRLLGIAEISPEDENERLEEEILDAISEGKAHGAVDEEQEDMIEAVFALHDTTVSAIMTPRTDIVAINASSSLDETRELVIKAGHSRIPVVEESLDEIVGVLYVKDLVRREPDEAFDIAKMMRVVPYVPETKTIDELLREFRQKRVHIAIVLDEYGGTAGLVTIEDILEELVGEIDDEYDQSTPPPISRLDEDTLEVDARIHVSEVNEELDVEIPENGDYETLGGFVFTQLGKIPAVGEEVVFGDLHIRVVSAEARKINRLRVHVVRQERQSA